MMPATFYANSGLLLTSLGEMPMPFRDKREGAEPRYECLSD